MRERDNAVAKSEWRSQCPSSITAHRMLKMMPQYLPKRRDHELLGAYAPGLRTTLMVGHSGEIKQHFEERSAFVKDNLGFQSKRALLIAMSAYQHYKAFVILL